MNNDVRKIFKDWINSPRYTSKLTFELCDSSKLSDNYTIVGLNARLKCCVNNESAELLIDFSGIVSPSDELWDMNMPTEVSPKMTSDNYYILDHTAPEYMVIKYATFAELLINECFQPCITLIEEYIEKYAYIYVFASHDGGSMGGFMPMEEFQSLLNKRLANKHFSQDPATVAYPHVYFAPLVKQRSEL
jgi:hypothetical protein